MRGSLTLPVNVIVVAVPPGSTWRPSKADAGFLGATFQGDAQFDGVTFERAQQFGSLLAREGLDLDVVQFPQPVRIIGSLPSWPSAGRHACRPARVVALEDGQQVAEVSVGRPLATSFGAYDRAVIATAVGPAVKSPVRRRLRHAQQSRGPGFRELNLSGGLRSYRRHWPGRFWRPQCRSPSAAW